MQIRAGMESLIDLVERLINDETNTNHSEQEIQDALDAHRVEARYSELDAVKSIAEGGTTTYLTYDAPLGLTHWASDSVLVDSDYAVLTPATSHWLAGRWTFSSAPDRPVKLLGFTYDVYAAAADLLDVKASMEAENLQSFSGQGGSYTYAAKSPSLRSQANAYRAKSRVQTIDLIRTDVNVF